MSDSPEQREPMIRVTVGADQNYPPYEYLDEWGQPTGFNIDLLRAIGDVMDIELDIRTGPWSAIRSELEAGRIDMLSGMFYSVERDRLVDFSAPHIVVYHGVFVRKGSSIQSPEDARGREIIVQRGDIMHDFVCSEVLSDRIVAVDDQRAALRLLASGKHDCALLSRLQGQYLSNKLELTNLTVEGPPILPKDYCFAVQEGNTMLVTRLNEGLSILNATGKYKEIRDRWFGVYEESGSEVAGRILGWIVLPGVVLFLVMWLWTWSLKKQVRQRTRQIQHELSLRRKAEDALRQNEARYRELLQHANSIILRLSATGEIIFFNEYAHRFFGYSKEEVIGRNVLGTILPERDANGQVMEVLLRNVLSRPDVYATHENENTRRDGERVWVCWTNRAIYDAEGRLQEILSIGTDVTERRRVEEALRESEERLRTLLNASPDIICFKDAEGRWLEANEASLRVLALEGASYRGRRGIAPTRTMSSWPLSSIPTAGARDSWYWGGISPSERGLKTDCEAVRSNIGIFSSDSPISFIAPTPWEISP